jgi:hypothetical protein
MLQSCEKVRLFNELLGVTLCANALISLIENQLTGPGMIQKSVHCATFNLSLLPSLFLSLREADRAGSRHQGFPAGDAPAWAPAPEKAPSCFQWILASNIAGVLGLPCVDS